MKFAKTFLIQSNVQPSGRTQDQSLVELLVSKALVKKETLQGAYTHLVYAYNAGDLESLMYWQSELGFVESDSPYKEFVALLGFIRQKLLAQEVQPSHMDSLKLAAQQSDSSYWGAEGFSLLGLCAIQRCDWVGAVSAFNESFRKFLECGEEKSAFRVLALGLGAQMDSDPDKNFIPQYQHLLFQAELRGDTYVSGIAHVRLAELFLRQGADLIALKHSEESMVRLNGHRGSFIFDQAVMGKIQILKKMGRPEEIQRLLKMVSDSTYIEVQKSLASLESVSKTELVSQDLLVFTRLERSVLGLLKSGPKDKFELIQSLYGDEASLESFQKLEDRLKNLLSRLRKKIPNILHLEQGKYFLSQDFEIELGISVQCQK